MYNVQTLTLGKIQPELQRFQLFCIKSKNKHHKLLLTSTLFNSTVYYRQGKNMETYFSMKEKSLLITCKSIKNHPVCFHLSLFCLSSQKSIHSCTGISKTMFRGLAVDLLSWNFKSNLKYLFPRAANNQGQLV